MLIQVSLPNNRKYFGIHGMQILCIQTEQLNARKLHIDIILQMMLIDYNILDCRHSE